MLQLPPPNDSQAYFDLTPLPAGTLTLPEEMVVSDPEPGKSTTVPSLAFLLRHSSSGLNLLFDLGIKADISHYSPSTQQRINHPFSPCSPHPTLLDSLHSFTPLSPADISLVFISHIHWDHIGDPENFPNAKFLLGGEAIPLIQDGYPSNPTSGFLQATVPEGRTTWLDTAHWTPIGPFERAHDFFGDGSLYVVDAPGHILGHINLLLRTSAHGDWAFLAADSAHDPRLLTGHKQIGHYINLEGQLACMHQNEEQAKDHCRRITSLPENVQIWLAHDAQWKERL